MWPSPSRLNGNNLEKEEIKKKKEKKREKMEEKL
jgi:hypothetical protein